MSYRFTARSASQAGPLKSGKAARGAGGVQPSSRSAIPGRSALGGRAGTLGARRGTHFTIERAHFRKLKSGAVVLMRPCAGSGHYRCGAGVNRAGRGGADARENKKDAIRERGDSQSWVHRSGPCPWAILGAGRGCVASWTPGGGCEASHQYVSCVPVKATYPMQART